MARRKTNEKRDNNTGSIYLHRSRYVLQYFDPICGKRRIKQLTIIVDGVKRPVTVRADAEYAANIFLQEITKLSEIRSKEEVIFQVAEQKKLIRSLTLKVDDVWERFTSSPARKDAGESTMKGYFIIWTAFMKFLQRQQPPINNLAEIDAITGEKYFSILWNTGISEQTYNNHLQVLTLIFKTLLGTDFYAENPLWTIRKKTRDIQKREALTIPQLQNVFALLAPTRCFIKMRCVCS